MPSMHFDAYACAFHDAGRRVPGRRQTPSGQLGIGLALAFKVTGSPAVLSQAVRGRNRD
jgi:hypothetical protein